jgi:hypothetical protein
MRMMLFFLTLFWSIAAYGSVPTNVQSPACGVHASVATTTFTLSGVTAGDFISVQTAVNSAQVASLSDSNGTPLQAATPSSSNNASAGIFYETSAAAGSHIFTLTVGTATSLKICASEWSNTGTLDGTMPAVATGSGVSLVSNSATPSGAGDLALCFVAINSASETFSSWTNGFVVGQSNTSTFSAARASQVYGSTSGLTCGVTASAGTGWSAAIALFKPSSPPAASPGFVISNGHALISNGKPVVN